MDNFQTCSVEAQKRQEMGCIPAKTIVTKAGARFIYPAFGMTLRGEDQILFLSPHSHIPYKRGVS